MLNFLDHSYGNSTSFLIDPFFNFRMLFLQYHPPWNFHFLKLKSPVWFFSGISHSRSKIKTCRNFTALSPTSLEIPCPQCLPNPCFLFGLSFKEGLSESGKNKKGKFVTKILYSDNVEWSSTNLRKMICDVKTRNKTSGGLF